MTVPHIAKASVGIAALTIVITVAFFTVRVFISVVGNGFATRDVGASVLPVYLEIDERRVELP